MWNSNTTNNVVDKKGLLYRIKITFHIFLLTGFALTYYLPYFIYDMNMNFPDLLFSDAFEYSLALIFAYTLYIIKGKHHIRTRIQTMAMVSILMLIVFIVLAYFKNLNHIPPDPSFTRIFDDILQYVGFFALLTLLFIFIDNLDYFLTDKFQKIEEALFESKSLLLRQQLEPHFLFNALNSIFSMSISKNPNTSDAILKLSNMMRYLTDEANVSSIPIVREINFLKEYIAIEKIRFGADSKINFEIEGDATNVWIEPLLLVTLAENAFKHGFVTNNKKAYVSIYLEITELTLLFHVKNWIPPKPNRNTEREGKGLANLEKRLQLSYPKKHEFTITRTEDQFDVRLTLNRN
jgi:sensor histidine kinase YesM